VVTRTLAPSVVLAVEELQGWRVTTAESRRGCARITSRVDHAEVLVGERARSVGHERARAVDRDGGPCNAFVTVSCLPSGAAAVRTRQAPPAIVVTQGGPRVTPADAGSTSLEHLDPGDRLLVLSSASFDEMPELLADLLCTTPDRLLVSDPPDLLHALFEATGQGAGALIERLADHDPSGGPR
jgi:hypothetical protein